MRNTIDADSTYTVYVGGTSTSKTSVATISAAEQYTVTFKAENGTELSSAQYAPDADVTIPEDQTKEGSTFKGWKVEGSEDSTAVKAGIKATADNLVYVPVFEANSTGTADITITYKLVKVDVSSTVVDLTANTQDITNGAVIYTSMTEPTLSKYEFVGWYTDEALTTKLDKSLTATADTTIYAKMVKTYKRGDANEDSKGNVTAADATAIMEWISNDKPTTSPIGKEMPGTSIKYGEANNDKKGNVTAADATAIMEWISNDKPATSIIGKTVDITKD